MPEKTTILSQNHLKTTRKQRLHWLLAVSSIPLFGVIAAFGIAPQTIVSDIPVTEVSQDIALPQVSAERAGVLTLPVWQISQTQTGDTLSSVLQRMNIRNLEAINYLRQAPEASALATGLGPGRSLLSKTTSDGKLLELQFQIDGNKELLVKEKNDGYTSQEHDAAIENKVIMKSAEIHSSLFSATDSAGISDQIAFKLADIFSSEIDFNLDLRKGDHLTVIYEAAYKNGQMVKTGKILAAEVVNQGHAYRAICYRDTEGHEGYYSPEGKSMHKSFLRSPLEFSRISSGFTLARFHPILQTIRAHKGVDYAAAIGTRVKTVADAAVSFVGKQGGYGNVIVLQHSNGISTVYGHLSRFATGLKSGQHLKQGDLIGFVGMTGLATGPHLHYEFRVNGEHRDPLTVALPKAAPLAGPERGHFAAVANSLIAQLDILRTTNLAALD